MGLAWRQSLSPHVRSAGSRSFRALQPVWTPIGVAPQGPFKVPRKRSGHLLGPTEKRLFIHPDTTNGTAIYAYLGVALPYMECLRYFRGFDKIEAWSTGLPGVRTKPDVAKGNAYRLVDPDPSAPLAKSIQVSIR